MSTTRPKPARALMATLGGVILACGLSGSGLAEAAKPVTHGTAAKPSSSKPQAAPANKPAVKPVAQLQPSAPPPPRPAAATATVFDDHVRQAGVVTCAKTFSALGRGISTNFTYAAQSQWDKRAGDAHAIQSLVALMPRPDSPTQQPDAGVLFAAPVGASCEGHMVQVMPTSITCPDIATQLGRSKAQNSRLGNLLVSTMPNGAQVMLIPFVKSCVMVTVVRTAG